MSEGGSPEELPPRPAQACAAHPERETATACEVCGRWICAQCRIAILGQTVCTKCRPPVPRWRAPFLLRLSLFVGWALLALAVFHRIHRRLYVAARWPSWDTPVFRSAAPAAPGWAWMSHIRWGHLCAIDGFAESWTAYLAIFIFCIAIAFARSDAENRGAIAWRAVLAVLLACAAVLLRADTLWQMFE